jgi:hypothetical protein
MTVLATKSKNSSGVTRSGRLFVLELSGDRIHSMNPDGSDRKTIVIDCHFPDGIVVDTQAGHIYWTNLGIPNLDDGSIERADIDGKNRKVIVPQGVTHTPKQLHLDKENGKLYWGDREGMRVMRANLDGSQVETLVETGRGDKDAHDQTRWCVGIAIDPKATAVAALWQSRTGEGQDIAVDVRKALRRFAGFFDLKWEPINGRPPALLGDPLNPFFELPLFDYTPRPSGPALPPDRQSATDTVHNRLAQARSLLAWEVAVRRRYSACDRLFAQAKFGASASGSGERDRPSTQTERIATE